VILAIVSLLASAVLQAQQPAQPATVPYSESVPYKPRLFKVNPPKKNKDKSTPDTTTQTAPVEVMPENGPAVKETGPIVIPVSVFDVQGNFIGDLRKEDFKVFVDGLETAVVSVERRDDPLNVLLVIDTSASSTDLLASTKRLATSMVDQFRPADSISVFKFSDQLKQLVPLTADRSAIHAAIDKIDPKKRESGGTSLYDITAALFGKYVAPSSGRTVVLLLTDGVDTTSRKTKYPQALVAAEKAGVTVFPVYLDTFAFANAQLNTSGLPIAVQQILRNSSMGRPTAGASEEEYALGRLYLNDLVYLSGGRAIEARSLLEGKAKVASTIADELRQQYYVTFTPIGNAHIGQRKHLKVRVNRPNLAVMARGSYIVGSPPSTVTAQ
jgi:VWFA-related protein